MSQSVSRIHLSPPHMSGNERKYIKEAFDTNWIAPHGKNIDLFEKELANYVGCNGAVALSSGTAAIHLALKLLNVMQGDYVFCSSLTFVASAAPILYEGAEPVFIDSEPNTWNMSPNALEQAFIHMKKHGKLPKAVIVVNLYGQSADMSKIMEICEYFKTPIIEDAAESLGATYQGRASGTYGKYGIYSFNGNKIITTSGGGMLVSNDLDGLARGRFLATQAKDPAIHYQHSMVGYNYRMSNVLAGIGRGQLEVLDERVTARRRIFSTYYNSLSTVNGIEFMPEHSFGRSSRWLTAMTVNPDKVAVKVEDIIAALGYQNIEARPVWKPLHLQPLFQNKLYFPHNFKNSISDNLFTTGICLPSGSNLTDEGISRVIECIYNILTVKSIVH